MRGLFTLVTLFALSAPSAVLAGSSCIAFDTKWNLLAFGFNGKDYNAGTSDTWASGTATDITTTGRPPFDGTNTKCYLAEFFNAIYVLGADSSQASSIYIYDATAKSWSTQSTTVGGLDPTSFEAILDHDTNFFYALSKGELWSLDMGSLVKANSSAIAWTDQEAAGITTTNYDPVMAIAQNHIYFFGVPNNPAGSASIFVIHFSFWQPGSQAYGGNFPDSHGQATSFFLDTGVQEDIAFIPDDGSHTYIVNVETNTTQTVAGPSIVDAAATYFASTTALVQLSSSGAVSWLPYSATDASANSAATWSTVKSLAAVAPPSSGNSSSSGAASGSAKSTATKSGSGGAATNSAGSGGSTTGSASNPSGTSAASRQVAWGSGTVLGLVAVAFAML
ncbi:hypothetical protein C8R44DRAFT_649419 [Mycena epipterygia]|nr:hypothetical protein C8R44DRAFT_649419 [Mycena epipterygia]